MTPDTPKPLAFIIEDDPNLVTIFAKALEMADFQVEMIRDGGVALRRLAETVPDVIVLDLHLPTASGVEIFQYIRGDLRLGRTRVILATADRLTAGDLDPEVDLVLLKPISFNQLRDLAMRLKPG